MDIEMDFECRECGWVFTRSFLKMEHGRTVKCQFCSGSDLFIRGEYAKEAEKGSEVVEPARVRSFLEGKIKL